MMYYIIKSMVNVYGFLITSVEMRIQMEKVFSSLETY